MNNSPIKIMNTSWILLLSLVGFAIGWEEVRKTGTENGKWTGGGCETKQNRPHIVIIMADDLGYSDIGYNKGSDEVKTPNIDSIALNGLVLDRLYGGPMCTPSRAAFLTGVYPVRMGLQSLVLFSAERRGLPLKHKLLPQYLRELGYETRLVGKWHLGHCSMNHTPIFRGFDHHLGYWTGHQNYYTHFAEERNPSLPGVKWLGYDMRRQTKVAWDLKGQYTTHIITNEAERIISEHDPCKPMYLQLSHIATHAGSAQEDILQAPGETIAKFSYISDPKRRKFAAMLSELDTSVGKTITALNKKGMLNETIILFLSDNGGTRVPFERNIGWNVPLRGEKTTLYEGGIRLLGALWTPWLKNRGTVIRDYIHMIDWLPTLVRAAGGDLTQIKDIDGMNHWDNIIQGYPLQRREFLVNHDAVLDLHAVIKDDYKLVAGGSSNQTQEDHYGRKATNKAFYQAYETLTSQANVAFQSLTGQKLTEEQINYQRESYKVECNSNNTRVTCLPSKPCLFNIKVDPCENNDRYYDEPMKVAELQKLLAEYEKIVIPPSNMDWDIRGNPRYWNDTWTNFCDYISPPITFSVTTTTSAATISSALSPTHVLSYLLFYYTFN